MASQCSIHNHITKNMYKKIKINQDRNDFPVDKLRVEESDGPDYPLFSFKGFESRPVADLKKSPSNTPRKSELIQEKFESLVASTMNFLWLVFGWPISVFTNVDGEWYFDHRHLVRALEENGWRHAPIAKYERKLTGNAILDGLSDATAMTLMGMRANATDNSENAKVADFYHIQQCMIDDNIPLTKSNIKLLLKVSGAYLRFPKKGHKGTIGGIINKILDTKQKSSRVFNTTPEEIKGWIISNPRFNKNKASDLDGVMCYHKILDEGFYYRYANDVLKWTWAACVKGEVVRVCASSKAICEHQIEAERQEMIDTIEDILNNTINWYISYAEEMFKRLNLKLPKIKLNQLPLELYWVPQIEGETDAIRVVFPESIQD